MSELHRLKYRAGRRLGRAATLALMLGVSLALGCARAPEPGPSKEEIWRQVYSARLEALRALDQAFNTLGQEYYKLEIEYRNSGRDDLAAISRERGRAFHTQHVAFKQRIVELEEIDARLRRGESAIGIEARRPPSPTPATPTAVSPSAPAPSPSVVEPSAPPEVISDPE
jgi:hypothetical protein